MNEFIHLFEALLGSFNKNKWGKGALILKLAAQWRKIVGDYVAKHTYPIKIVGNELIIGVDNHVLMHQLSLQSEVIKENIEKKTGIRDLEVRFVFSKKKYNQRKSKVMIKPLSKEEQGKIEELTSKVKDQELRQLLNKTIASLLARRKT
ncbi:conserved hypothetical protein [Thermosulfidibacter takaii ABI70S6]|uniref:DUF721 domain-containing protein n=1 Tax=Thermosulfidibacter takaii (strain DSM 17441 / JCM 13301 / NBRC 103674 / ABI70S6) TaxID=1298851 RepID=A0A0S3QSA7_THET7|nr:DUF721 domain-containing protein [Thermosulfidibacter takaii]BAT71169.1 conserved hypothetical protein [Thermosulfidibacter takaii ABI70S6]